MALKQQIEQDLKTALLSGDDQRVMTLRSLKNAVLYAEVAKNVRETGLSDDDITQLFLKESKKRQESADLYSQGHNEERAKSELNEKQIIDSYLPKQLSDSDLQVIIDDVIRSNGGAVSLQAMGQIIGKVKQKVGASADGSTIARLTKDRLSKE